MGWHSVPLEIRNLFQALAVEAETESTETSQTLGRQREEDREI